MICSANGIKPSMPPPIRQIPPSLLNEIVFIDFLLSLVMNLNYLVYHSRKQTTLQNGLVLNIEMVTFNLPINRINVIDQKLNDCHHNQYHLPTIEIL